MAEPERKAHQPPQLPYFSEDLADRVFTETTERPRSFLITTASHMNEGNPEALDYILESSFRYVSAGYPAKVGLGFLRGSAFIYGFFRQHAIDNNTDIRRIPKSEIDSYEKRHEHLKESFKNASSEESRQKAYQEYRDIGLRVFKDMEQTNRFLSLAQSTWSTNLRERGLSEDEDTLILVGVVAMYNLFESTYRKPEIVIPELERSLDAVSNSMPIIDPSIARMGLVHILLDPTAFTQATLQDMEETNRQLYRHVRRMAGKYPDTQNLQLLLSSYSFYCLNEAYRQSGRSFPVITDNEIQKFNAMVSRQFLSNENPRVVAFNVLNRLESVRIENNEFYARVMILLQTYVKQKEGGKFGAVMGGVGTVFTPLQEYLASVS